MNAGGRFTTAVVHGIVGAMNELRELLRAVDFGRPGIRFIDQPKLLRRVMKNRTR